VTVDIQAPDHVKPNAGNIPCIKGAVMLNVITISSERHVLVASIFSGPCKSCHKLVGHIVSDSKYLYDYLRPFGTMIM
jgi:hypothetical protein